VRVLDLFAGSGSLGVEALSRGASHVVFVDRAPSAAAAIGRNLSLLNLTERARVINADFRRALTDLARSGDRFQLILVDAPFKEDSTTEVLALIGALGLLAADGILVTRQFHRAGMPQENGWERINLARIGDHRVALYRRRDSADARSELRESSTGGEAPLGDGRTSGKEPHAE
jgi:16S rRNA (guanine(966)-N(2))-methyltransferase RsmD